MSLPDSGWWDDLILPVAVRPYFLSYEFGKSSTRLFTGRILWNYLLGCGLHPEIRPCFEVFFTYEHCLTYDDEFTFNPKSYFGRSILSLPLKNRIVLLIECVVNGGLYVHTQVNKKRILPLISRKRTFGKHHFDHLRKPAPKPTPPLITLITPSIFKPRVRTVNEIKILPWKPIKIRKQPFNTARTESKPREGVG
jgi:hypothetical protein